MKEMHNNIYIALGSNLRSFSHKNVKVFFNSIIFRLELLGLKLKKKSSISSSETKETNKIEQDILFNIMSKNSDITKIVIRNAVHLVENRNVHR